MRKIIFVLAFLISGCDSLGFSETVVTEIQLRGKVAYLPNTESPFTGRYDESYDDGQKKTEVHFKKGILNGLFTEWYKNGQKRVEKNYTEGKLEGLTTVWYEGGQKNLEENFKNGIKDGLFTVWFNSGEKKSEAIFKEGKTVGVWAGWYPNKQKFIESNVETNCVDYSDVSGCGTYPYTGDGVYTEWYENGQKWKEKHFKNGQLDGVYTAWNNDGKKKIVVANYKNGLLNGAYTEWNAITGKIDDQATFKDGYRIENIPISTTTLEATTAPAVENSPQSAPEPDLSQPATPLPVENPPQPATAVPTVTPEQLELERYKAKDALDEANKQINLVWNSTTKVIRKALLPEQKAWLKQREDDCSVKASNEEPNNLVVQETIKLTCMATMTNERTEVLKQDITNLPSL